MVVEITKEDKEKIIYLYFDKLYSYEEMENYFNKKYTYHQLKEVINAVYNKGKRWRLRCCHLFYWDLK